MLNLNFQNGRAPALNARNMNAIVESINALGYAVGGPNVANTASEMTNTSKVYVYAGSETGYTAGNWYYYNGAAWVSGGVYQAAAVETDTTLTMPGVAADAKATGDAIKTKFDYITEPSNINLFNPFTITKGYGINSQTGELAKASRYDATDFIAVDGSYFIKPFEWSGTDSRVWIFKYSTERTFIERVVAKPSQYSTGYTITHTGFIRIQIDNGTVAGSYENAFKYMVASTAYDRSTFIPFYAAIDSQARYMLLSAFSKKSASGITDANTITAIGYYYLSATYVNNLPGSGAWYVVNYPFSDSNMLQLAYNAYGTKICARAVVNGTWGDWSELPLNNAFLKYEAAGITDANNITTIGYYYLSATYVDNLPDSGAWYLYNTPFNATNTIQTAISAYGNKKYTRAQVNGTWSDWNDIDDTNMYVTSSIAMFPSIGCCGDSFTAGYLYNKTDSPWYDPNYAPNGEYPSIGYPAVMERLYGVDVTAFAQGGLTSTQWRTATKGLPALLADSPKYLYIIALGLNDVTQDIPLGVEGDIDTEPATPSYLGNMGAIIRSIQSHAPYAKIVLCKSLWVYNAGTTTPNSYYTYISQGVELLSSHLGIPYIETLNDPYFSSSAYVNGLKGLHPTAPLYAGMGKRIGELIGKCIIDNPNYFYNFYVPNT